MEKKFPSEMQEKFTVRFPDGMRDKIAEQAKSNNRSMNAEIITALEIALSVYNNADSEYEKNPFNNPDAIASLAGLIKTIPRKELESIIKAIATTSATQAANVILAKFNKDKNSTLD